MKVAITVVYLILIIGIFCLSFNLQIKSNSNVVVKRKMFLVKNNITPKVVFMFAFAVYSVIGMINRIEDDSISNYMFLIFFFCNTMGIICFLLGYGSDNSYVKKRKLSNPFDFGFKKQKTVQIATIIIFLIFIAVAVLNYREVIDMVLDFGSGESYLDYSIRGERTALSGVIQALKSYFYMFFLLFPFYNCYKKGKLGLFDSFIFLIVFAKAFFSGDRTTLILIAFMAVVVFNAKIKNISIKLIIFAVLLGMFALILLGHLRVYNSLSDMLQMIKNNSLLSLLNVNGIGEFRNTTGTLISYISVNQKLTDFSFFNVYITEFLIWIPSFLFPNRPLPPAEQYMLDFFPDALEGTGHGWYILTDGYMAFGIIGIALEMLLFGKILKSVYKRFFSNRDDAIKAFMYAYFLLYVFYSVRSSMMLIIKNYIIQVFPVILLDIVLKKVFNRRERRRYA